MFQQFKNINSINISNTGVVDLLPLINNVNLYKIAIKGTSVPIENSDKLKSLIPAVEIDRGKIKEKGLVRTFRQVR